MARSGRGRDRQETVAPSVLVLRKKKKQPFSESPMESFQPSVPMSEKSAKEALNALFSSIPSKPKLTTSPQVRPVVPRQKHPLYVSPVLSGGNTRIRPTSGYILSRSEGIKARPMPKFERKKSEQRKKAVEVQAQPQVQPNKQISDEKKKSKDLNHLVYLERKSPFLLRNVVRANSAHMIRLRNLQHAFGMLEGVIRSFDPISKCGEIEVDNQFLPFVDSGLSRRFEDSSKLQELIGQRRFYTFSPTAFEKKENPSSSSILPMEELRLIGIRDNLYRNNFVEMVGQLSRMWDGGFEIKLWSSHQNEDVHIYFQGTYPYPDELGHHVWVIGSFESATQILHFEETEAIAWVPKREAISVLQALRDKRIKCVSFVGLKENIPVEEEEQVASLQKAKQETDKKSVAVEKEVGKQEEPKEVGRQGLKRVLLKTSKPKKKAKELRMDGGRSILAKTVKQARVKAKVKQVVESLSKSVLEPARGVGRPPKDPKERASQQVAFRIKPNQAAVLQALSEDGESMNQAARRLLLHFLEEQQLQEQINP